MGSPEGRLGICILQGSHDGCCCKGGLSMEVFCPEELAHRDGDRGFFELGLTREYEFRLVMVSHDKHMGEHKKWDLGLVHNGRILSPTPSINHVYF